MIALMFWSGREVCITVSLQLETPQDLTNSLDAAILAQEENWRFFASLLLLEHLWLHELS